MLKVSIVPERVPFFEVWFPLFISFLNLEKNKGKANLKVNFSRGK